MSDLKYTITRSYSRKFGNYNSDWASSSHTIEISRDEITEGNVLEQSKKLEAMAEQDVNSVVKRLNGKTEIDEVNEQLAGKSEEEQLNEMINGKEVDADTKKHLENTDWKVQKLYDKVRKGEAIPFSEWDSLTESQKEFLHKAQLLKAQEERLNKKDAQM